MAWVHAVHPPKKNPPNFTFSPYQKKTLNYKVLKHLCQKKHASFFIQHKDKNKYLPLNVLLIHFRFTYIHYFQNTFYFFVIAISFIYFPFYPLNRNISHFACFDEF